MYVCTLTGDGQNGKRRLGHRWVRHWQSYPSLDPLMELLITTGSGDVLYLESFREFRLR